MKVEIAKQEIESRIFTIRGMQVMLDRDLACLYLVTTKVLNQAVKRNILRFPEDFMFQLTAIEKIELVTNCDRLEKLKHSTALPFVFTEHGVAMLSSVLRSEAAIEINISIMRTFVQFRKQEFQHFRDINFLLKNQCQIFEIVFNLPKKGNNEIQDYLRGYSRIMLFSNCCSTKPVSRSNERD